MLIGPDSVVGFQLGKGISSVDIQSVSEVFFVDILFVIEEDEGVVIKFDVEIWVLFSESSKFLNEFLS